MRSLGCTRERLAQVLGVTSRSLRYWATGRHHPPKAVVVLLRLFEARREAHWAKAPMAGRRD